MNELQIRERDHLSNDELVDAAPGRRAEGGQGPVAHPAPGSLPARPVRPADRLGAAQVPARRRLHPRRLGSSHRHPRRHRPADAPHRRPRRSPRRRHRRRVGRASTASRSSSCSKVPPAASSPRASTANASRSTPSTSSAPSPVACPAPVSSATHYRSEGDTTMETRVDEIADRIYRLSTVRPRHRPDRLHVQPVPHRRRRAGHLPHRTARMFPSVSEAIATVLPLERLRWIMFGHSKPTSAAP